MALARATFLALTGAATLSGCGALDFLGGGNQPSAREQIIAEQRADTSAANSRQSTIWDLFANTDDPNTAIEVNKYIWNASLDVLDFLPIEAADPFSGVMVFGYGSPPGGGPAYRATVYVQDPALDARSLNVALVTRGGPASLETVRAVEDAILTRARQLRIRDSGL